MEGSHYEIGKQLGKLVKQGIGTNLEHKCDKTKTDKTKWRSYNKLLEDNCSGLGDEVQGFSDELNISVEEVNYYYFSYSNPKKCSQFLALSSIVEDSNTYLGRSYEWIPHEEDLILLATRINGKTKHIGCSEALFGRTEGLNDHGLCVSMTGAGIFGVTTSSKGLYYWVLIRAILDQCKTVDEAKEVIISFPAVEFFSLLLVDKNDHTLHVELADGEKAFNETKETLFYTTNHFKLPEMQKYNKLNCGIIDQSKKRSSLIESRIQSKVKREDLIDLLSKEFPEGLCHHYYSDCFGTLWSLLFNTSNLTLDACFGAPTHSDWKKFDLKNDPIGIKSYLAIFPNLTISKPPSQ